MHTAACSTTASRLNSNRSVLPAQSTWDDHANVQRMGHRAYFEQFGFTIAAGLLSAEQVAQASSEVDRIIAEREALPNVRVIGTRDPLLPSYDLEDAAASGDAPDAIRKITGFRALSPVLAACLVEPPGLLDILHSILGARVELYRDALMLKTARVGQEKPWHQDAVYWPFRPMHLVSAMFALDHADAGNGCLQVVPFSHQEIHAHEKINAELRLDIGALAPQAMYVPLAPGDCLIFHSLLLHASEHNDSGRNRRASICSYSPGNLLSLDASIAAPLLLSKRECS